MLLPPASAELADLEAIAVLCRLAAGAAALADEPLDQQGGAPHRFRHLLSGTIKKTGGISKRLLMHPIHPRRQVVLRRQAWSRFGSPSSKPLIGCRTPKQSFAVMQLKADNFQGLKSIWTACKSPARQSFDTVNPVVGPQIRRTVRPRRNERDAREMAAFYRLWFTCAGVPSLKDVCRQSPKSQAILEKVNLPRLRTGRIPSSPDGCKGRAQLTRAAARLPG